VQSQRSIADCSGGSALVIAGLAAGGAAECRINSYLNLLVGFWRTIPDLGDLLLDAVVLIIPTFQVVRHRYFWLHQ